MSKIYNYYTFDMLLNISHPLLKSEVLFGWKFRYHLWIVIQSFWIKYNVLIININISKLWNEQRFWKIINIFSCHRHLQRLNNKINLKNQKSIFSRKINWNTFQLWCKSNTHTHTQNITWLMKNIIFFPILLTYVATQLYCVVIFIGLWF